MLLPQFTTRRLFAIVTVASILCLLLSMAPTRPWAAAVSISLGGMVLTFLAFAASFQLAYVMAKLLGLAKPPQRPTSPFAKDTAPPVIVRPGGEE